MKFFSGFSLENEEELFEFWLKSANDYTVVGFSYGAIKAVEYLLSSKSRVDRLILLSPAYFNNKDLAFKKMQLIYFKKEPAKYVKNFLTNINTPKSSVDLSRYLKDGLYSELKELLYYEWNQDKLQTIIDRGVTIEVVLGESDKIIDSKEALEFFSKSATIYLIKDANHILRTKDD